MSQTTKVLNGILCVHDITVTPGETNTGVLFLHNEREPLGVLVGDFSGTNDVSFGYFASDHELTEEECDRLIVMNSFGQVHAVLSSESSLYSEVTPDLCWVHKNEFTIGGHDMNRELSTRVGKWLLIRLTVNTKGTR